jgi:hypothetical protein
MKICSFNIPFTACHTKFPVTSLVLILVRGFAMLRGGKIALVHKTCSPLLLDRRLAFGGKSVWHYNSCTLLCKLLPTQLLLVFGSWKHSLLLIFINWLYLCFLCEWTLYTVVVRGNTTWSFALSIFWVGYYARSICKLSSWMLCTLWYKIGSTIFSIITYLRQSIICVWFCLVDRTVEGMFLLRDCGCLGA